MIQLEMKRDSVPVITDLPEVKMKDPLAKKIVNQLAKDIAHHFNKDGWGLDASIQVADFIYEYFGQDVLQSIFTQSKKLVPDLQLVITTQGLRFKKKELLYAYYSKKSDRIVTRHELVYDPNLEYLGVL